MHFYLDKSNVDKFVSTDVGGNLLNYFNSFLKGITLEKKTVLLTMTFESFTKIISVAVEPILDKPWNIVIAKDPHSS